MWNSEFVLREIYKRIISPWTQQRWQRRDTWVVQEVHVKFSKKKKKKSQKADDAIIKWVWDELEMWKSVPSSLARVCPVQPSQRHRHRRHRRPAKTKQSAELAGFRSEGMWVIMQRTELTLNANETCGYGEIVTSSAAGLYRFIYLFDYRQESEKLTLRTRFLMWIQGSRCLFCNDHLVFIVAYLQRREV